MDAAVLLEEEGDIVRGALVADVERPRGVHGAEVMAALSADDDPVEVGQPWSEVHSLKQRFGADEPHLGGDIEQVVDALLRTFLVFYGRAEPDIRGEAITQPFSRQILAIVLRALGEELPVEVGRRGDELPESRTPFIQRRGAVVIHDVAHATAEYLVAGAIGGA